MIKTEELDLLKINTRNSILNATNFMIQRGMDDEGTKIRSTSPTLEKYGIWPTTEFLEFLLTNDILPITPKIVELIEGMIGFIIDKYKPEVKKWPLTDAEGSIASAITSGHCIYVLKLYISRPFVDYTKTERIKQIIRDAETALVADCRSDGSWKILDGDDAIDPYLNYGRFFYTYNAWFGLRKVDGYTDDLSFLPNIKSRLSEYVIGVSDNLIKEARNERNKGLRPLLICNIAKAIQILNDYSDNNCIAKRNELYQSILESVQGVDMSSFLSSVSSVEISELPNSGYNKFSNNIPFDLFFAIKDRAECFELVSEIINWYLSGINTQFNCWFFPGSNMNTWPTCEALLVLAYAHAYYFSNALMQKYQEELDSVQEKYKECQNCKNTINDYLKPQREQFEKFMADFSKKVKQTSFMSIGITIFSCICAIIALITLSVKLEQYWLNTLITVVIVPLILQIVFVVRMPENMEETQSIKDDVLSTIEEKEKMWKDE